MGPSGYTSEGSPPRFRQSDRRHPGEMESGTKLKGDNLDTNRGIKEKREVAE